MLKKKLTLNRVQDDSIYLQTTFPSISWRSEGLAGAEKACLRLKLENLESQEDNDSVPECLGYTGFDLSVLIPLSNSCLDCQNFGNDGCPPVGSYGKYNIFLPISIIMSSVYTHLPPVEPPSVLQLGRAQLMFFFVPGINGNGY